MTAIAYFYRDTGKNSNLTGHSNGRTAFDSSGGMVCTSSRSQVTSKTIGH